MGSQHFKYLKYILGILILLGFYFLNNIRLTHFHDYKDAEGVFQDINKFKEIIDHFDEKKGESTITNIKKIKDYSLLKDDLKDFEREMKGSPFYIDDSIVDDAMTIFRDSKDVRGRKENILKIKMAKAYAVKIYQQKINTSCGENQETEIFIKRICANQDEDSEATSIWYIIAFLGIIWITFSFFYKLIEDRDKGIPEQTFYRSFLILPYKYLTPVLRNTYKKIKESFSLPQPVMDGHYDVPETANRAKTEMKNSSNMEQAIPADIKSILEKEKVLRIRLDRRVSELSKDTQDYDDAISDLKIKLERLEGKQPNSETSSIKIENLISAKIRELGGEQLKQKEHTQSYDTTILEELIIENEAHKKLIKKNEGQIKTLLAKIDKLTDEISLLKPRRQPPVEIKNKTKNAQIYPSLRNSFNTINVNGKAFYASSPREGTFTNSSLKDVLVPLETIYEIRVDLDNQDTAYYTLVRDLKTIKHAFTIPNTFITPALQAHPQSKYRSFKDVQIIEYGILNRDGKNWVIKKRGAIELS